MIHFEHGAFCAAGIAFHVPDGFFLETDPEDEALPWGISLYAPDQTYNVRLYWEEASMGSEEELNDMLSDGEYVILSPVAPLTVNGLEGFHAAYQSGGYGYYEARFDLSPNEDGLEAFIILVCTDRKETIGQIQQRKEFNELIRSLKQLG